MRGEYRGEVPLGERMGEDAWEEESKGEKINEWEIEKEGSEERGKMGE